MMEEEKTYYSFMHTLKWLLSLAGIKKDKSGNIPVTLHAIGVWLSVFSLFFFIVLKLILGVKTLENFLAAVLVGAISFHLVIKQAILIIKRKQILSLLENIDYCFTLARADPKYIEKNSLRIKNIGNKFVILLVISTVITFGFQYISHELNGDKSLPVEMWTPNGDEGTTFTTLVYQLSIVMGGALELVVFYALFFALISFATMIMGVLKRNIAKGPEDKETIETFLSRNILVHAELLKILDEINIYFSPIVFLEILLSSIQCCCAGYLANFKSVHNAIHFVYFLATLILPGLICYLGQEIKNKYEGLFNQVYDSPWYTATPKQRRYYLMMLSMTSKPLILHFRFLMTFDLERYANVLQAGYSYITILQNMSI